MAFVLVCISVTAVQQKCAKGSQKENVDNSKITCKGDKLFKADEKLARGAGVNVVLLTEMKEKGSVVTALFP